MTAMTPSPLPSWGDQGRVRNWFHTKPGARFLNAQTRWFNLRAPRGYTVLTTVGRRTGTPRRACLRAVLSGQRAIIVATGGRTSDWLLNIESNPHVTMRIGRATRTGVARTVRDDEVAVLSETFSRPVYLFDRVASVVNQRGLPTNARIRALHEQWCKQGMIAMVDLSDE